MAALSSRSPKTYPRKKFVLRRATRSRRGVFLRFPRLVTYRVIKLGTQGLPRKGRSGRPIRWIANWKIKDDKGKVVRKTHYTLYLPKTYKKGDRFVYYLNGRLHWDKIPTPAGRGRGLRTLVKVNFETGDPPAGWD